MQLDYLGWGLVNEWDGGGISVFFLMGNSASNSNGLRLGGEVHSTRQTLRVGSLGSAQSLERVK